MAEGRWEQTASILAMTANVNRDPRKHRRFAAADFNPLSRRRAPRGIPLTADNVGLLKALLPKGGNR